MSILAAIAPTSISAILILALLNQNMNHAIASSLRALRTRSATEPYLR
ncbi:hypothetical protein [Nostoc sp.]